MVGVGGVVIHAGKVLLVRRGKQPLRGRWTVPGGTVELGETLEQAVVRELLEETGVRVRPRELLLVFDRIQRDARGVQYHFVILDYLCDYVCGEVRAGSDADEAALVAPGELAAHELPDKAREVVLEAFGRAGIDVDR